MSASPLQRLRDAGQSIWLDFIDRTILHNGELVRRIRDDALTGMTSNPTIFEKAMAEGTAYDAQIAALAGELDAGALFERIETDDVREACDLFRPTYEATGGADGYVSIEVSPGAAHDADSTVTEAHRLRDAVRRPNVMVKVPGTEEGAVAVRRLTADGLNVNITLLFSVDAYASVIEAHMAGLEERVQRGQPVRGIASVASFFVSRVDTEVDKRLDALARDADPARRRELEALRGRAAVANAKSAYALFQERVASPRWRALAAAGARCQRPLWASTSTKNPAFRDVMYVEQLIGPDTVNTMPPATIEAFRDHGVVERTVDRDVAAARELLRRLAEVGVDLRDVTATLLVQGLQSFGKSFDTLTAQLERKAAALRDRSVPA